MKICNLLRKRERLTDREIEKVNRESLNKIFQKRERQREYQEKGIRERDR